MALLTAHLIARFVTDSSPSFRTIVLCRALAVAAAVLWSAGCGASVGLTERAPATDGPAAGPVSNAGPARRGVVEAVTVKRNLVTREPEANLAQDLIAGAKRAGLFSELSASRESRDPMRDIGISLSVSETLDTHRDENQMRQERIERSWLLPIITPFYILYHRFEGDFESHMVLEVERWDGETRRYTARARGRMEYPYNADPEPSQQELIRQVTANALESLVNQLAGDRGFLMPPPAAAQGKPQ